MKTDELIALLATNAGAVEPGTANRRLVAAVGWGAFGSTLMMAIMLGVRGDVFEAARLPMFWIKLAFPTALALGSLVAASRLSRPGARLGWIPAALAAPVLVMWLLAAVEMAGTTAEERRALVMGISASSCPFTIAILAVPTFVATLWTMKGLAPTRLVLCGAAAGLLAGAVGATVYALYCIEMAASFLGVWYLAGMLIPALVGALLSPLLLRW